MDATGMIDDLINQHSSFSISLWILLFAVIATLVVLGLEFWRNFFGMLGSPGVTFQRLMGEVSLPPSIFVVVVAGFLSAIVLLCAWNDKETGDAVVAQFNIGFDYLAEKSADTGGILPEQINFLEWFTNLQRDMAYSLTFFVLMPIGYLAIWLLGGVGFHFGSMFGGNKGGGGIGGLLAASAYTYLPMIMVLLFSVKMIYPHWFNTFLLILFGIYYVFLWTLLMREHGRFNYVKGFISFIVGLIFSTILVGAAFLGMVWLVALIMSYM